MATTEQPPSRLRAWMLEGLSDMGKACRPAHSARRAEAGRGPALVPSDVPDGRRLLLDPRLPAGHRGPRGRPALTHRDHHPRDRHPGGRAAGLSQGGGGEPARAGLDLDAGAAAHLLEGQTLRPDPARLRRHRLPHHHHALRRGRLHPPGREPPSAQRPARPADADHPRTRRPARRGVPQGLPGGDRRRRRSGRALPRTERRRRARRPVAHHHRRTRRHRLVERPDGRARQRVRHDRHGPDRLPEARPRSVRLRDRRRRDAARQGRRGGHRGGPAGPDPGHQEAAHRGRPDHELLPDLHQLHHHAADPREGVRGRRPGQRPRPRVPRARLPRRRLRHGLRRLDHRHPLVRRLPPPWPACST